MNTQVQSQNAFKTYSQMISFIVVAGLLILTAYGNAEFMFWTSTAAMFLLFVWCLSDRKVWLSVVSGVAFVTTAFLAAKSLF